MIVNEIGIIKPAMNKTSIKSFSLKGKGNTLGAEAYLFWFYSTCFTCRLLQIISRNVHFLISNIPSNSNHLHSIQQRIGYHFNYICSTDKENLQCGFQCKSHFSQNICTMAKLPSSITLEFILNVNKCPR